MELVRVVCCLMGLFFMVSYIISLINKDENYMHGILGNLLIIISNVIYLLNK